MAQCGCFSSAITQSAQTPADLDSQRQAVDSSGRFGSRSTAALRNGVCQLHKNRQTKTNEHVRVLSGCTLYSLTWPHPLLLWSECQLGFAWLRNSRIVVFCESSKLCLFCHWLKKDVNYDNKEAECKCETTLLKNPETKQEKLIISWHKITVPVCFFPSISFNPKT